MYLVENILVDENIHKTNFLCDLNKCKGGCCTIYGYSGAPLLDEEIPVIQENLRIIKKYLSSESNRILKNEKFYQGEKGDYSTLCIDNRDCIFVYYEDGSNIAFCAIEKAYNNQEINFKKPLSCHLFPIRQGDFGGKSIYYEKMDECKPALKNGKKNKVKIYEMTKESLVRAFGLEWYKSYCEFLEGLNKE